MKRISKWFIILSIFALLPISCSKARFENLGNAIKGIIPEDCVDCQILYVYGGDDWKENFDFGMLGDNDYSDGENGSLFRMSYERPGEEFYARVDWFREPLATPKGMHYVLVKQFKNDIYEYLSDDNILMRPMLK